MTLLSFPITDPTAIFTIVVAIILLAPLCQRVRIPYIIGLIVAGVVLGPHGFNVLAYDSSFHLLGKVGILYIMFLAGLEIDAQTLRQQRNTGISFGVITFLLPLCIGSAVNHWILGFNPLTSMLLSTIYSAHTLMSYPIVSKMGISTNRSSAVVISGTIVTVSCSLLLLAVTTSLLKGGSDWSFLWRIGIGITLSTIVIGYGFPKLIRYLLRTYNNTVTQYLCVLFLMLLAALLAMASGLEGVLGAFIAGLVLGRFIPTSSPLMTRIQFVGNALFIPFFLISIGMEVNVLSFFSTPRSALLALVMTLTAIGTKWLSAWCIAHIARFNKAEQNLCFGLTIGKASATLAVIMIGYGMNLWDNEVINAVVVMIIIVCTVSSIVTERSARTIAEQDASKRAIANELQQSKVKVMVPVSNSETLNGLMELAMGIKTQSLYALQVVRENTEETQLRASQVIAQAHSYVANHGGEMTALFRSDASAANGIIESVHHEGITDLCLGIHQKSGFTDSLWGGLLHQVTQECNDSNIWIYRSIGSLTEIGRIVVAVTPHAEHESGFTSWMKRLYALSDRLNKSIVFISQSKTINVLRESSQRKSDNFIEQDFTFNNIANQLQPNDLLVFVSAKENTLSFVPMHREVPKWLHHQIADHSWIVLFSAQ